MNYGPFRSGNLHTAEKERKEKQGKYRANKAEQWEKDTAEGR